MMVTSAVRVNFGPLQYCRFELFRPQRSRERLPEENIQLLSSQCAFQTRNTGELVYKPKIPSGWEVAACDIRMTIAFSDS